MNSRTILFKKVLWCSLFVLWSLLIIFLTTQNGSESGEFSGFIAEKIWRALNRPLGLLFGHTMSFSAFHFFIRKLAHFSVHFVFAFIAIRATIWNFSERRPALVFAWIVAILVAILDEAAQLSVPGRASAVTDAGINLAGVFFGAFLSSLLGPKSPA